MSKQLCLFGMYEWNKMFHFQFDFTKCIEVCPYSDFWLNVWCSKICLLFIPYIDGIIIINHIMCDNVNNSSTNTPTQNYPPWTLICLQKCYFYAQPLPQLGRQIIFFVASVLPSIHLSVPLSFRLNLWPVHNFVIYGLILK
jgi:hypothetical protein